MNAPLWFTKDCGLGSNKDILLGLRSKNDYSAGCGTQKIFLGYDPPQIVVQPMIFVQPISGPVKMAKHPIAHKWLLCTLLFTNDFCDGIKYENSP